jgi:hypothetical protein
LDKEDPDYPIYSKKVSRLIAEIESFVSHHESLRLCADICNGAKHLRRSESLRYGERVRVRTEVHIDEKDDQTAVKRVWKIISISGKEWDVLELALDCVEKWAAFLKAHEELFKELMNQLKDEDIKSDGAFASKTCNPVGSMKVRSTCISKSLTYEIVPKKE